MTDFDVAADIKVRAYLSIEVVEDNLSEYKYGVKILYNGNEIEDLIIHESSDAGILSDESIRRRSMYAQLIIDLATFLASRIKMESGFSISVGKEWVSASKHLDVIMPDDFAVL